jgi:hypothetical protein
VDETQQERFKAAVERKKDEAQARWERHPTTGTRDVADEEAKRLQAEQERELRRGTRTQGDARASNTGHGKKTADKWNQ